MIHSSDARLTFAVCALVAATTANAVGGLITDSVPTASAESGDPFGLPGSGLARDYFGVADIIDVADGPDEFFIAGTQTNYRNDFPVWPVSPLPGDPAPLMGRNLDHIDPDGNGNQNFAGQTATWSVTVPADVIVTSVEFNSIAVIRQGPTGSDFEIDDDLTYVLTAPGSGLDGSGITLSANDVDDTEGDGSYLFPSGDLFSDGTINFATVAPTEYKVVVTVGAFDATAEAFWTSGTLSVNYIVPEPGALGLAVLGGTVCLLVNRQRRTLDDR